MLGISYGELFLLLGATAPLIGPKDLPIVARTAGGLAGRAIAYVQLARGQFDSVMQQTQARQAIKYLRNPMARIGPQFLLLRLYRVSTQLICYTISNSCGMHIQAVAYAKLAESLTLKTGSSESDKQVEISDESDLTILPLSAESAGLLPKRSDDVKGSDIVLEAIIEAAVAWNAKDFFAQPQNQIKYE